MTERLYATGTNVSPAKSQAEIQGVLLRYGATSFACGFTPEAAAVEFGIEDRRYRIRLPLPDQSDPDFTHRNAWTRRPEAEARNRYDAEVRRRWRALLLIIKSRLEAAATGISTIAEEFALAAVLPDGRTAAEHVMPAISHAYTTGELPPILGALTAPDLPELEAVEVADV